MNTRKTAVKGTIPPIACPNCGAAWTPEEKALKECWTCGYPDHEEDDIREVSDQDIPVLSGFSGGFDHFLQHSHHRH